MANRVYQNIDIRGEVYPDANAASLALGVHPNTVRRALRNGTLHRVGMGRPGPKPMRVRIDGKVFEDVSAAAAHFGVKPMTIYSAILDGDPDRVARPTACNPWNKKPFTIGKLTFPSMAAASRALGFEDSGYIAQALRRGSRRGRERIVSAALVYISQGKHVEVAA